MYNKKTKNATNWNEIVKNLPGKKSLNLTTYLQHIF